MGSGGHLGVDLLESPIPYLRCPFALHTAARLGHVDIAEYLISEGLSVNAYDETGNTPLILAVNGTGCVKPLDCCTHFDISLGDDDVDQNQLCCFAGSNGHHEQCEGISEAALESLRMRGEPYATVDLLLRSGAEINQARQDGITALHLAVLTEELNILEVLVAAGADLEARTSDGLTPLLLAALIKSPDQINLLVQSGADIKAIDNKGRNALLLLVSKFGCADVETVRLLACDKDQINFRGPDGCTPVMKAAFQSDLNTVNVLLELGADHNVVGDFAGLNALEDSPNLNINSTDLHTPCTLISILLHNVFLQADSLYRPCLQNLIQRGALYNLPDQYYNVLLFLVETEPKEFTRLLVTNSWAPKYVHYPLRNFKNICEKISPFGVALLRDDLDVAEYFVDNWFLTTDDLVGSKSLASLRDYLISIKHHRSISYLDQYESKPMSLALLSFTVVSTQLGGMVGREERVRKLPVPKIVKNKLLFLVEENSMQDPEI